MYLENDWFPGVAVNDLYVFRIATVVKVPNLAVTEGQQLERHGERIILGFNTDIINGKGTKWNSNPITYWKLIILLLK